MCCYLPLKKGEREGVNSPIGAYDNEILRRPSARWRSGTPQDDNHIFMPFILINKPVGPTSHDMINKLRRITGIKKIGHAGTLDPFAEGLLLVAIGRESTREISKFVGMDKKYLATLKLGATSDTQDRTGSITPCHPRESGDPDYPLLNKEGRGEVNSPLGASNFYSPIGELTPSASPPC